ncbi:hypothetical protein [Burkholderia cenocepacia]|uniref:hypothetical protein n=1 Tax=Burkholderia cenocepacia TaxID=95486 RepID=UPI0012377795|nr:hypothetical protein [Burkholderia cenocepacia]
MPSTRRKRGETPQTATSDGLEHQHLGTLPVSRVQLFAAHGDGGERAVGPVLGYCRTRASATLLAAGRGYYGRDGDVFGVPALQVGESLWLLAQASPIDVDGEQARRDEELRQETLSQLSAEQRRVLGLA